MSKEQKKKDEQRFVETCLRRLEKNRAESADPTERPKEWYDFHSRTDQILVPSKWVSRLEEANAVNNELQYLREKLEADLPVETKRVDREALYCSSALHKIRQNTFYQRLHDHQARWQPVLLVGELAASLPKPTTDPAEIERQLYMSLMNKK